MQAGRGRIMQTSHSQAANKPTQLAKQAAKKPSNQADRHMQAARPTTNKRDTRREQAMQHTNTHSEPASMPAKQPGHQPARQPPKQPASQTEAKTSKTESRDSNTHSQAEALVGQLHGGSTSLPQKDSIEKPLGSHCNPCFTETKHDLKAMKSKEEIKWKRFFMENCKKPDFGRQGLP